MIKSPITSAAKRISNTNKVKGLNFNRKEDLNTFVKWIESSNKEINKVKLPKKRDLKKISKGLQISGGGGGGALLPLLAILGGGALLSSSKGIDLSKLGVGMGALGLGAYGASKGLQKLKGDAGVKVTQGTGGKPRGFRLPGLGSNNQVGSGTKGLRNAASLGRLGKANVALNVATAGLEYAGRLESGQTQTQAIAGTTASTVGGIGGAVAGGKAGALLGGTIGAAFGGVGALPGAAIGGILGSVIGGIAGSMGTSAIVDKVTGASEIDDRLKEQEEKQKAARELTFSDILNKFDKVVTKFEKVSFSLSGVSGAGAAARLKQDEEEMGRFDSEGMDARPPSFPSQAEAYDGPVSGDQFFPLPGGTLSTREVGVPGGEYGAPRNYGGHSGQDIGGLDPGSPVVAWKTGKLRYTGSVESGDTILTIDHGGGVQSVYKHVVPTVPNGSLVYGGQQIASLFDAVQYDPHLHFEVWRGGSDQNPMTALQSSQRIPSPLSPDRAKQSHEESIVGTTKPETNTIARQQSPEEFFKGTQYESDFNKYKEDFYGEGTEEQRKSRSTSGVAAVEKENRVKELQNMYNSYVRNIRAKREAEAAAVTPTVTPTAPEPTRVTVPTAQSQSNSAIILTPVGDTQMQPAGQNQMIPVPIASGSNKTSVVPTISEVELLNSLWNTLLLTKLSEA